MLWLLLFSANLVDYFATKHALSHGCHELNPLVASLLRAQGFQAVLTTKIFFLTALLVLLPFIYGWKLVLLAIATLVYLAVATYQIYGMYLLDFI